MRLNIRFLSVILCIILLASVFIGQRPVKAQGPASNLREVHLRMCAEGLSPIQPSEDEVSRKKSVPNGFEHGILNRLGTTVYKTVGEWEQESIAGTITIVQPVVFILWASTTGSTSATFRFTLKYGSAVIAGPVEESINSLSRDAKKLEVTTTANLTTTQAGKALTLFIEGKVNGDGVMVEFGDVQKDSGVKFLCDAVKFNGESFHACEKKISVEFMDSFRAPINSLHPVLIIDGNLMDDEDEKILDRSISESGLNQFTWRIPLEPGTHDIAIGIAYAEKDINTSWGINKNVMVKVPPEESWVAGLKFWDMDLGDQAMFFVLLSSLIIFIIVTFVIVGNRAKNSDPNARLSPVPRHYGFIMEKRKVNFSKMGRGPKAASQRRAKPVRKRVAKRPAFRQKT